MPLKVMVRLCFVTQYTGGSGRILSLKRQNFLVFVSFATLAVTFKNNKLLLYRQDMRQTF